MQDYDWELPDETRLTKYSQHTAHIDFHFDGSVKIGYTWRVQKWRFSPALGFLYRTRKWSASDGYLQYGYFSTGYPSYVTGNEQKRNLFGTSISYEQTMYIPFIDFEVGFRLNEQFEFMLDGSVYPYMWIHSLDNHFLKGVQYYDLMNGGIGGTARLSVLWRPSFAANRFAFRLNVGFEYIGSAIGSGSAANIGYTPYSGSSTERKFTRLSVDAKMDSISFPITLGIVFFL
jgi:hypothetical protein